MKTIIRARIEAKNIPAGVKPIVGLFSTTNKSGFTDQTHDGVPLSCPSPAIWEGHIELEKPSPEVLKLAVFLGIGKGATWTITLFKPGSEDILYHYPGGQLTYGDVTQAFLAIDKGFP